MVERPIKKSERLEKAAAGDADETTQQSETQSSERERKRPEPRKGGKGKGKGGSREEQAPKQGGNPALMRGPKPARPKPAAEEVPPEEVLPETEAETTGEPVAEGAEEALAEVSA